MFHEEVKALPPLKLLPYSASEWENLSEFERARVVHRSERVWLLKEHRASSRVMAAVGVRRETQVSPPEVWLLLCKGFERKLFKFVRELRALVPELRKLYPDAIAWVDSPMTERFANLIGFK